MLQLTEDRKSARDCVVCGCNEIYAKSMCRRCYGRDYAASHREQAKKANKEYKARNPAKVREWRKAYAQRHPDRIQKNNRAYDARYPEKKLERNRAYRAAHPEKSREYSKRCRDRCPEKRKEYRSRPDVKARQKAWRKEWLEKNPDGQRWADIKTEYGITKSDFLDLLESQCGVCAICGNPPPDGKNLNVDHDHETGAVRGLLCRKCNLGIGHLGDSADRVRLAMEYLTRHQEKELK